MTLHRLARELDETARQTSAMVEAIGEALDILADPEIGGDDARRRAIGMIVTALQAQDRIEQRCRNLALAAAQFDMLPPRTPEAIYDEIWATLSLDELRVPALHGIAAKPSHGDVELF